MDRKPKVQFNLKLVFLIKVVLERYNYDFMISGVCFKTKVWAGQDRLRRKGNYQA